MGFGPIKIVVVKEPTGHSRANCNLHGFNPEKMRRPTCSIVLVSATSYELVPKYNNPPPNESNHSVATMIKEPRL